MTTEDCYSLRCSPMTLTAAFGCRPLALAVAAALYLADTVSAATVTVNSSTAASAAGSCTIVDAVASTNQGGIIAGSGCTNGGGAFGTNDTINFSSNFTISFTVPAGSANSALLLSKAVTIDGGSVASGVPRVIIERGVTAPTDFRIFQTNSRLTLKGLTVRNGVVSDQGAGISSTFNSPVLHLNLVDSIISGNTVSANSGSGLGGGIYANNAVDLNNSKVIGNRLTAPIGKGGGVYSHRTVTLLNSTIAGNGVTATTGSGYGGGIDTYGTVYLTNSTVSRNSVDAVSGAVGGGICNHNYRVRVIATNSTISGNRVNGTISNSAGGGIFAYDVALNFSTITGNSAPAGSKGGGVAFIPYPSIQPSATASLISGNSPYDLDANGSVTLGGDHNIIGTKSTNVILATPSLPCANLLLGPLGDNGGLTKTHGLLNGSCAIDVGPPAGGSVPTMDQRALPRPFGPSTDIGAVEKQASGDPDLIFADGFDPPD